MLKTPSLSLTRSCVHIWAHLRTFLYRKHVVVSLPVGWRHLTNHEGTSDLHKHTFMGRFMPIVFRVKLHFLVLVQNILRWIIEQVQTLL